VVRLGVGSRVGQLVLCRCWPVSRRSLCRVRGRSSDRCRGSRGRRQRCASGRGRCGVVAQSSSILGACSIRPVALFLNVLRQLDFQVDSKVSALGNDLNYGRVGGLRTSSGVISVFDPAENLSPGIYELDNEAFAEFEPGDHLEAFSLAWSEVPSPGWPPVAFGVHRRNPRITSWSRAVSASGFTYALGSVGVLAIGDVGVAHAFQEVPPEVWKFLDATGASPRIVELRDSLADIVLCGTTDDGTYDCWKGVDSRGRVSALVVQVSYQGREGRFE